MSPPIESAAPKAAPAESPDGTGETMATNRPNEWVGRVVAVSGSQVIALLQAQEQADGAKAPAKPQIGTLMKMRTPSSTVFGMVSGLSIPIPRQDARNQELSIIEIEMVGEAMTDMETGDEPFQRGVSVFPTLDDGVYTATTADLRRVYACPAVDTVPIGTIHQDKALPAFVMTDNLLGKHFAILGTTGSGKSCAVALILRAILERHRNALGMD